MLRLLCAVFLISSAALAEDPWVLVRDEQRVSMSGDLANLGRARSFLTKFGPGYLWFRHAGKEYVIRDGKVLAEVEKAVGSDQAKEEQEARLDEQDAELEHHQAKIDKHQAEIEKWEDTGADTSKAKEQLARAQERLQREQEKLHREQEKMAREDERIARQTEKKMAQVLRSALRSGAAEEVKR
jgi:phage-related minor tail protein